MIVGPRGDSKWLLHDVNIHISHYTGYSFLRSPSLAAGAVAARGTEPSRRPRRGAQECRPDAEVVGRQPPGDAPAGEPAVEDEQVDGDHPRPHPGRHERLDGSA